MFRVPEHARIKYGPGGSTESNGNNGWFVLAPGLRTRALSCIVSDQAGWDHVSTKAHPLGSGGSSAKAVVPSWQEMCYIKATFWDAEDVVMQLHPRASDYVNHHHAVLHLWRPQAETGLIIPEPPLVLV